MCRNLATHQQVLHLKNVYISTCCQPCWDVNFDSHIRICTTSSELAICQCVQYYKASRQSGDEITPKMYLKIVILLLCSTLAIKWSRAADEGSSKQL